MKIINLNYPKMKKNNFVPIVAISILFFHSCGRYSSPTTEGSSKLPTSIDNGSGSSNKSNTSTDSDEYERLLRKAEADLRKVVQMHNIADSQNPEFRGSRDPKILIFAHIESIKNELTRLKNQPKPKPIPQPAKSNNQSERLQAEIVELRSNLEAKNQEILRLNEEIKKLNEQIARNIKPVVVTPVIPPPAAPEVFHSCKIQLKKSKKFVKDVQIKGDVITFNFKVRLKDIKTKHPQNSYSLESNNHTSYLTIKNPKLFWVYSNELIVWGSKEYHSCLDKDFRKK